jgi:hypothetical protein
MIDLQLPPCTTYICCDPLGSLIATGLQYDDLSRTVEVGTPFVSECAVHRRAQRGQREVRARNETMSSRYGTQMHALHPGGAWQLAWHGNAEVGGRQATPCMGKGCRC